MTTTDDHWILRSVECPVCEATRSRFLGYRGGWAHREGAGIAVPVVRCRDCGTTYPNPTPFPRDHSHYDAEPDYFASGATESIRQQATILERAASLLGAPGRFLDVGCGIGYSLAAGRDTGWDGVGLEPSESFAARGRAEHGGDIRVGFLEPGLFPPGSFDAVLLSGVLEHVYNPIELLALSAKLLRLGGVLYVDVPNEASWFQEVSRFMHRLRGRTWAGALSPTFPPFHVVGFSRRSLSLALDRAGLRVEQLHTYPLRFRDTSMPAATALIADGAERAAAVARLRCVGGLVAWARRP